MSELRYVGEATDIRISLADGKVIRIDRGTLYIGPANLTEPLQVVPKSE